jgi:type II secretory pathway pseudopilin PulG
MNVRNVKSVGTGTNDHGRNIPDQDFRVANFELRTSNFELRTSNSELPHSALRTPHSALPARAAFTMVEIAISLAVIGFALVAIIGILPMGMEVQRDNREETIINQEATLFMEAIRGGAQGMDYLATNYVYAITNYVTFYATNGTVLGTDVRSYTATSSADASDANNCWLTNGFRVIGLLSTPRFTAPLPSQSLPLGAFNSNHVVAYVRSISGAALEKYPQDNGTMMDSAFTYRLLPEVLPFTAFDTIRTNYLDPIIYQSNTNEWVQRSNYWMYVRTLQTNINDIRLIFRWPVYPNGTSGNGRLAFRATGGTYVPKRDPYSGYAHLYFFQPRTLVKTP